MFRSIQYGTVGWAQKSYTVFGPSLLALFFHKNKRFKWSRKRPKRWLMSKVETKLSQSILEWMLIVLWAYKKVQTTIFTNKAVYKRTKRYALASSFAK